MAIQFSFDYRIDNKVHKTEVWMLEIEACSTGPLESPRLEVGNISSITRFTKKITTIAIEMTLSNDVI